MSIFSCMNKITGRRPTEDIDKFSLMCADRERVKWYRLLIETIKRHNKILKQLLSFLRDNQVKGDATSMLSNGMTAFYKWQQYLELLLVILKLNPQTAMDLHMEYHLARIYEFLQKIGDYQDDYFRSHFIINQQVELTIDMMQMLKRQLRLLSLYDVNYKRVPLFQLKKLYHLRNCFKLSEHNFDEGQIPQLTFPLLTNFPKNVDNYRTLKIEDEFGIRKIYLLFYVFIRVFNELLEHMARLGQKENWRIMSQMRLEFNVNIIYNNLYGRITYGQRTASNEGTWQSNEGVSARQTRTGCSAG